MARAPFQVLVYPYLKAGAGRFEYALLKRSDAGFWQAIAGGGEDDETPLEAARREAYEEAGIPGTADFLQLGAIVASAANQLVSLLVANFVDTTIGATNMNIGGPLALMLGVFLFAQNILIGCVIARQYVLLDV